MQKGKRFYSHKYELFEMGIVLFCSYFPEIKTKAFLFMLHKLNTLFALHHFFASKFLSSRSSPATGWPVILAVSHFPWECVPPSSLLARPGEGRHPSLLVSLQCLCRNPLQARLHLEPGGARALSCRQRHLVSESHGAPAVRISGRDCNGKK